MRARTALLPVVALAALIQVVPYGRGGDPAVVAEAPWPSDRARELAVTACYDCHSRAPERPWYAQVAPASWLVQRDIDAGRDELDFSAWEGEGDDAAEEVLDGSMPPRRYSLLHPGARLDIEEQTVLAAALAVMDAMDGGERGRGRGRGRGDRD